MIPDRLLSSLRLVATLAVLGFVLLAPAAGATLVPDGPRIDVGPVGDGFTSEEIGDLAEQRPFVLMDDQGGFIVFWRQIDGDPARPEVVARKYEADGTPNWTTRPYWDPVHGTGPVGGLDHVAGNGAGDFVIGWLDESGAVHLRVFDFCGDALADTVEVGFGGVPDGQEAVGVKHLQVGVGEDRELVVAFVQVLRNLEEPAVGEEAETFDQVVVRRYALDGTLLGPEIEGPTATRVTALDLAVDGDGSFALASEQVGASENPFLLLESFDADGERLVTPPPADPHLGELQPDLAYDGGGRMMLAFEDASGADGECSGIFARFRQGGQFIADEAQVEPDGAGCQSSPLAAGLAAGWVAAWDGADGARSGLRVRTYAADGTPEGGAVRVLPRDFVGPAALAASADRAVVVAVLPVRPGAPPQLVVQRLGRAGEVACGPGGGRHRCFHGDRFRVDADWRNPYEAGGSGLGRARGIQGAADSATFWFFRQENLELLVKVLDGRGVNGHWWVFFGSLSTVEFWVAVTDLETGEQRLYHNPAFEQASVADAAAFAAESAGDEAAGESALASLATGFGRNLAGGEAPVGVIRVPARNLAGPARVAAPLTPPLCGTTDEQLCLRDAFAVTVTWKNPRTGEEGVGHTLPLTGDTGAFWFFRENNAELMVKVLDGTAVNGHFWVFYAGLSDVEYTLTVDPPGSEPVVYTNAPFELRSGADTAAISTEDAF